MSSSHYREKVSTFLFKTPTYINPTDPFSTEVFSTITVYDYLHVVAKSYENIREEIMDKPSQNSASESQEDLIFVVVVSK